jgi:hypothetical protein
MNKLSSSLLSLKEQLTNIVEGDVFIPEEPITKKLSFGSLARKPSVNENRWKQLNNGEYIIREEYSPFPLLGTSAVMAPKYYSEKNSVSDESKEYLYVLGGKHAITLTNAVNNSLTFGTMQKLYHVKDIDWSHMELKAVSEFELKPVASSDEDDVFSLKKKQTSDVSNIPKTRSYHTLNRVSKDICLLYGGLLDATPGLQLLSSGLKLDSFIYELNIKNQSWTRVNSTTSDTYFEDSLEIQFPKARVYHASCSLGNNNLFVFGGLTERSNTSIWPLKSSSNQVLADLWVYNSVTKTWKLLSSPEMSAKKGAYHPAPRSHHSMVISAKHNKLYIIGGCSSNDQPFKEIIQYDLRTNEWVMCGFLPVALDSTMVHIIPSLIPGKFGAAATFDDFIFIIGGETLISDEKSVPSILDDVLIYSIPNSYLIKGGISSWKTSVTQHTLLYANYQLYMVGGRHPSYLNNQYNSVKQIPIYHTFNRLTYGKPLVSVCDPLTKCPSLVTLCVDYLLEEASDFQNLFNKTCPSSDLLRFRMHYEIGNIADRDFMNATFDENIVATALIDFLNNLPEPILGDHYREFLDTFCDYETKLAEVEIAEIDSDNAMNADEEVTKRLHEILKRLPEENQAVLLKVLFLMNTVAYAAEDIQAQRQTMGKLAQQITSAMIRPTNPSQFSVKDEWTDRDGYRPANRMLIKLIEKAPLIKTQQE